jgi:hypothetical protein
MVRECGKKHGLYRPVEGRRGRTRPATTLPRSTGPDRAMPPMASKFPEGARRRSYWDEGSDGRRAGRWGRHRPDGPMPSRPGSAARRIGFFSYMCFRVVARFQDIKLARSHGMVLFLDVCPFLPTGGAVVWSELPPEEKDRAFSHPSLRPEAQRSASDTLGRGNHVRGGVRDLLPRRKGPRADANEDLRRSGFHNIEPTP